MRRGLRRDPLALAAGASALAWSGLLATRGRFWAPGPWLPRQASGAGGAGGAGRAGDAGGPFVVAVVPARNEAELLPVTLPPLLAQRGDFRLRVVLVDDGSDDGTAEVARRLSSDAAAAGGEGNSAEVLAGTATPEGWAPKVWAMAQGVQAAGEADWLWFTDADIVHGPGTLASLLELAGGAQRDAVSVMARLRTSTRAEKLLVPAFVWFFAMLYPFRWVGDDRRRTAAAAGGCLLVRAAALRRAGGLAVVRGAVIDDLAIAGLIAGAGPGTVVGAAAGAGGRLWLGFDHDVRSVRPAPRLADLWKMVARSAYTELDHSPLRLAGALGGLGLLFAVPPLALAAEAARLAINRWEGGGSSRAGAAAATVGGGLALALQVAAYLPTVRMYGLSRRWAATLPAAGVLYGAMTASSAAAHHRGRGVTWRGRTLR